MAAHDDQERKRVEKRLENFQKARNLEAETALRNLLATHEGRVFAWWLLTIGGIGKQPFSSNALNTAFACGELNVGQQVLAKIISVDSAAYVRMMQESQDDYSRHVTAAPDTAEPASSARPGAYDTGADSGPDTVVDY